MKIWIISRECAEIAEAGGVKNVTFSLCKELSELKNDVTLFIPIYRCTSYKDISQLQSNIIPPEDIQFCGKFEHIEFNQGICNYGNFKVIFINHPAFSQKEGIYTYTENEQKTNPEFIKGTGHRDTLFMDILFQQAILTYGECINTSDLPDIIHCQDASTACLAALAKDNRIYNNTKFVVTIHNAGPAYHHSFGSIDEAFYYTGLSKTELKKATNNGRVEPFLLSAHSNAFLTTVSEQYAKELTDPANNSATEGLSQIFFNEKIEITGITNGIDYDRYNPQDINISQLPFSFNPESGDLEGKYNCRKYLLDCLRTENSDSNILGDLKIYGHISTDKTQNPVFISYHGRITSQKGITVLIESIPAILNNYEEARFIIAGQGEIALEEKLIKLTNEYQGKIVYLKGYDKTAVRLATASCDFAVLPSFFEPCGLEDFIAQIYGTLPVAHKTGGLTKIDNYHTGFLYSNNDSKNLIAKLSEVIAIKINCPEIINSIIKEAAVSVHEKYLWKKVIEIKYLKFFEKILNIF